MIYKKPYFLTSQFVELKFISVQEELSNKLRNFYYLIHKNIKYRVYGILFKKANLKKKTK